MLTPQAIASSLFSTSTTGTFISTSQRFAYNQSTGNLYYDSQGNKTGSTVQLVAHLTNDPKLTAANLFFISWSNADPSTPGEGNNSGKSASDATLTLGCRKAEVHFCHAEQSLG
jgi:hypothetical protein